MNWVKSEVSKHQKPRSGTSKDAWNTSCQHDQVHQKIKTQSRMRRQTSSPINWHQTIHFHVLHRKLAYMFRSIQNYKLLELRIIVRHLPSLSFIVSWCFNMVSRFVRLRPLMFQSWKSPNLLTKIKSLSSMAQVIPTWHVYD